MKRLQGINQDVDPIDQPQGTYRDALNAVLTERLGAVTSEGGNVLRDSIPAGYEILGDTLIYDGRHILFITDGTNSEIGIFNGASYTTVLSDTALNFQTGSIIDASSIINNQGEVVVYWTDNINPPRYYNIDADEGFTNIDNINLFPTIGKTPEIRLTGVNSSGGTLKSGAYYFLVSYIAEDDSRTNYLSASPPVLINDDSNPDNHNSYDGVSAGTSTSKSIQLELANLDQDYENLRIAVIRKEGNTIGSVELLPEIGIQGENITYTYTGSENTIQSSLQEVITNTASYKTARTIVEQDNTLYLGNLTKRPDIGYQKYANNITVESDTKIIGGNGETVESGAHFGDPEIAFYDKSFKRGEVYALYISFILNNGQESTAYHIPGRVTDGVSESDTTKYSGIEKYKLEAELGTNNMGFWENENETYPDTEDFDVYDVDNSGNGSQAGTIRNENVRHHHFPEAFDSRHYTTDDRFVSLGFKLKDVKIPADIIDQIKGVKVYYAKRTDNNRRVIDQGVATAAIKANVNEDVWDGGEFPEIPDDFVISPADEDNSSDNLNVIFVHGFNALRTKKNIGSVTHIKQVTKNSSDVEDFSTGVEVNTKTFHNQTETVQFVSPVVDSVKAASYIPSDSFVNNAISNGFSYNIHNYRAEETIAIELDNNTDINDFESSDLSNAHLTKAVDLIQLQNDLYLPFDQQELVWTGVITTNMDQFDPRVDGSVGGATASGSIDITQGVDQNASYPEAVLTVQNDADQTGTFAEGYIEVTANNLATDATEDHTISVDGDSTAPVTIADTDTLQDIVTKYRDQINNDGTISTNWTATIDNSSGEWRCVITADAVGSGRNNAVIDVTGETDVVLTTQNTSGGTDPDTYAGDISIDFGTPLGNYNITYQVPNDQVKDQVASNLANALNSVDLFSFAFNAVVDTVPTNPTVTITAVSNGAYYNSTLFLQDTSGANTIADGDIYGGADDGVLDERQPIGWIDFDNVTATGDVDLTMSAPPNHPTLTDTVTIAADNGDTPTQTAVKAYNALIASTDLSGYTFFQYEDRVYYYYPNSFDHNGAVVYVQESTSVGSVDVTTQEIGNGRQDWDGTIGVTFSTPVLSKTISVNLTLGDNAATVETKIVNALNGDTDFSSDYTATDASPISITADAEGSDYNGNIDIQENSSGVVYTISDLSGGQDSSVTGQFQIAGRGGDTYISYIGFRRRTYRVDSSGSFAGGIISRLYYAICESDDNIKLRHQGSGKEEIYYPKSTKENIVRFEEVVKTGEDPDDLIYNNFIGYNPDYSASAEVKAAIPSSKESEDVTQFPTRVIRTAEGDSTEGDTGIRTFLENDYLDLTRSRGELVKLTVMQNTLIPHMERSLIRTRGREELTTGDFRAFLGSGDIFSVTPDELLSTREGFAGLQDQRCAIVTPTGYFFIDRAAGQVILMGKEGPEIISENGLKNFFQEELSAAGEDEFICAYDSEWNRIMLTRKGHWTVSYYPSLKAWGSFHSYDPEYYLYDLNTFYTLKTNGLYEHNIDNDPCHFYGAANPDTFEFEFISNPEPTKTKRFRNIQFITDVEDSSGNSIWNETFDQFRVSNAHQDSGDRTITVFSSLGDGSNARNVEGTWKINDFRDMLVNGVVDNNKPWQDQSRFISKYLKVKLTFNNSNQKSIYLYDAGVSATLSRR